MGFRVVLGVFEGLGLFWGGLWRWLFPRESGGALSVSRGKFDVCVRQPSLNSRNGLCAEGPKCKPRAFPQVSRRVRTWAANRLLEQIFWGEGSQLMLATEKRIQDWAPLPG